jgi:hypothetical protein
MSTLQSLLQQGFAGLKYERRVLENEIGIFETFPLDNKLWISFRLTEAGASLKSVLEKEYVAAISLTGAPMDTHFYEGKVHSFLSMKQPVRYIVMNRPIVLATA